MRALSHRIRLNSSELVKDHSSVASVDYILYKWYHYIREKVVLILFRNDIVTIVYKKLFYNAKSNDTSS